MYVYWGFRARQHLRSLAPLMNDKSWWKLWPNIRGSWGPKASWRLSHRWGIPPKKKNLTQEICPVRDRSRTRCVTGAHATARPTAVDPSGRNSPQGLNISSIRDFSPVWRSENPNHHSSHIYLFIYCLFICVRRKKLLDWMIALSTLNQNQ